MASVAAIAGGRLVKQAKGHGRISLQASRMQARSFYAIYEKYTEAYRRYGWKLALWKLYNPGDIKFGKPVGEDEFGNKYYEDPNEIAGQQRWTEFHVDSFKDFDASHIPPQWHLWMHQITDALPGSEGQKPENWPKVPISYVSDAPYTNHLAESVPYTPNKTQFRTRGYGIGSIETKPFEPDQYYIQRGHVLRKRASERSAHYQDEVDYNNPTAEPNSSESLRPLDKN